MGDIDVKVGIQVSGDASGAQQVDSAVRQVGQTAQDVSRKTSDAAKQSTEAVGDAAQKAVADAGTVADRAGAVVQKAKEDIKELKEEVGKPAASGGVKEQVDGLADALENLSPEKAKGAVGNLANAIIGLASGDTSKGLEGLARSFSSLASFLPNPALATAVGAAVVGIVSAWRKLTDGADEATRATNEFGETIDEEMTRLEAWGASQFEFANLKSAIADVKSEFDSATKTTNTFRDAVLAAIDSQYSSQATGLRQQASDARAGGDEARAAALEEEAARRELISKIAQERVELEALEQQYKFQREKIKMAEESMADLIAKEKEVVAQFDALKESSVKWSGNIDAAFGGEARDRLVSKIEEEIAAREKAMKSVEFVESQRPPIAGPLRDQDTLAGIGNVGKVKDAFSEIPSLRELVNNLKLAEEQAAAYNDAVASQKTNYSESKQAILEEGRALAELNAQRIRAAQEYAAAIAGIDAGVVDEASRIADGFTRLAERSAAAVEAASQAGTGMVEAVETFGSELGGTAETAAEAIGEGNKALRGSIDETEAVGNEIKAAGEEARTKLSAAATEFRIGAIDLKGAAGDLNSIARGLALEFAALSRDVAATMREASAARAASSLALSQLRNR